MSKLNKVKINDLNPGDKFKLLDERWVVLEKYADGSALVVNDEKSPERLPFDKNGSDNWKKSTLREYLNGEYLKKLAAELGSVDLIRPREVDLTALSGRKGYGVSVDRIAPLTLDQRRKHRDLMTPKNDSYWTVTSDNAGHNWSLAWFVNTAGSFCCHSYPSSPRGVAPACHLESEAEVSVGDA